MCACSGIARAATSAASVAMVTRHTRWRACYRPVTSCFVLLSRVCTLVHSSLKLPRYRYRYCMRHDCSQCTLTYHRIALVAHACCCADLASHMSLLLGVARTRSTCTHYWLSQAYTRHEQTKIMECTRVILERCRALSRAAVFAMRPRPLPRCKKSAVWASV
jgi:hypothetical protein